MISSSALLRCPMHREAVRNVPVLLEVRDVEEHRVAHLHALDVVRREVAADRGHVHVHRLAVARRRSSRFRTCVTYGCLFSASLKNFTCLSLISDASIACA